MAEVLTFLLLVVTAVVLSYVAEARHWSLLRSLAVAVIVGGNIGVIMAVFR